MINPELPTPLYMQLAAILRDQIESGKLTSRVPSIRTLAEEHEVSTRTAEKALNTLEEEGLLVVAPGKGFYVVP